MSRIVKLSRLAGLWGLVLNGLLFAAHPPHGSDATPRAISEPVTPLACNNCLDTAIFAQSVSNELALLRREHELLIVRLRRAEERAENDQLQRARLVIEEAAELRAAGTKWRE